MPSEVGSGQVSIVPVFRGFRSAVTREVDGTTKASKSVFDRGFRTAGSSAGRGFTDGFRDASSGATKALTDAVSKASREVSAARLKELDATGRVRVAEAQLAEARSKGEAGSSGVVRAEERLAAAQRGSLSATSSLTGATDRLAAAHRGVANAAASAAEGSVRSGGSFSRISSTIGGFGSDSAGRFSTGFKTVLAGALGANILTGIGASIGQGILTGVTSALRYGFDSVGLASDFEQSVGAIESVFKDQAPTVLDFGKDSAKSVGLSRAAYLKFATVVGAQLKNLKVPFDQVAEKTDGLITLGADLAAQFGGSTSDAVGALSSLLRGERDPIERYGVSLKQVDIDARKAQLGLSGLTGEADKQADITATLGLLYEQTADAQGTFFKESDTYAGKLQRLNAALEDSKASLGESLLPGFTAAAEYANRTLVPAIGSLIDKVGPELAQAFSDNEPKIKALLDKLVPLGEEFAEVAIDNLPGFIDSLSSAADSASTLVDIFQAGLNTDNFIQNFNDEVTAFLDTINGDNGLFNDLFGTDVFGTAEKAGSDAAIGFTSAFTADGADRAYQAGNSVSFQIAEGARRGPNGVSYATKTITDGFSKGLTEGFSLTGQNAGEAFASGLTLKKGLVGESAAALGREAETNLRKALRISSPSKVFRDLGRDTGDGLVLGLDDRRSDVGAAAGQLLSIAGAGSAGASGGGSTDSRQYINVSVSPEQDPRIVGRQLGREYLRQTLGSR